jgi:hypothetical protein
MKLAFRTRHNPETAIRFVLRNNVALQY